MLAIHVSLRSEVIKMEDSQKVKNSTYLIASIICLNTKQKLYDRSKSEGMTPYVPFITSRLA